MSAYAQLDNELRAVRTKEGMTAAVNAGNWAHRAPIGYINASVPGGFGTQLEAAGLIEGEAVLELAELELLLDLADWMLANAAGVWASASWENKLRIQKAFFPAGLEVSSDGFGTPQPLSLFS